MTKNNPIIVTPEIPKSLVTPLELEILECYGYEYEDDGSYQFTNTSGGVSTLEVSDKDLSNNESENAVELQKRVNNRCNEPENSSYSINLGNISVNIFSAEKLFQNLLKKPNAKALVGEEILLRSHDWIARITATSIQQASLSSLLFQWRNPIPLRAAIVVEGGIVQNVLTNPSNALETVVIDYDEEDTRVLISVKQPDDTFKYARVIGFSVEEPQIDIDRLFYVMRHGGCHGQ